MMVLADSFPSQNLTNAKPETIIPTETNHITQIELLDKAEHLARQFSGGYSSQFLSVEEFHAS